MKQHYFIMKTEKRKTIQETKKSYFILKNFNSPIILVTKPTPNMCYNSYKMCNLIFEIEMFSNLTLFYFFYGTTFKFYEFNKNSDKNTCNKFKSPREHNQKI